MGGQRIALSADPELPALPAAPATSPDYPPEVDRRFVPTAYEQADPSDPNTYGNYDPAQTDPGQ